MLPKLTALIATSLAVQLASAQTERFIFATDYSSGNHNIVRMKEDGSALTQLTSSSGDEFGFDVSPDGTTMVFNSDATGMHQVYSMNLATMQTQQLTFSGENMFPRFSPDGSKLLVNKATTIGGHQDIFTMNPDGTNSVNLTNSTGQHEGHGDWSPDGTKITFSKGIPNGEVNVWTMDANGSNMFQVTNMSWDEWSPNWSPDGTQIVFYGIFGNWDIVRVNADGSGLTRLTDDPGADQGGSWTPESQILFTSHRNQDSIFRMNADGSGVTMIRQGFFSGPRLEVLPVPEPATIAALSLGAVAFLRRKANRK